MTDATDGENTWDRLRRRKVVQWGLAYAAGAWGFLQGLQYVSDAFGWPTHLRQLAILALLIGLPIVLVIAWYHGDRGEQRVTRVELGVLTLLFLLGGGLFWRYELKSLRPSTATTLAVARATPPASAAADNRPSIAVLPFENRSAQQGDVFFVDGIHDDILTQLTKIGAIKVISRTSVEQFRDTTLPIKAIAEKLGVKSVLEGGVQRAGDRVRISVQLIDAANEAHLWAESYDRELTVANIFAIQSEVAAAIAAAMQTTLTPSEQASVDALPTRDLEAWEAFQLGRQRMAKRTSSNLAQARAYFQKAIDRDPEFALAYAGLADAIWLLADFSGQPFEPAALEAEKPLRKALELDPKLAEALTTTAKFAQVRREFERAEAVYRQALAINPNYPTAYFWLGQLLALQGRDAEALLSMRKAVSLDPLAPIFQMGLASFLSGQGDFDAALAGFDKVREIDSQSPLPYEAIGVMYATAFGRLDRAVPFVVKAYEFDATGSGHAGQLGQLYLDLGDDAQAQRWLDLAANDEYANGVRQLLYLYRGDLTQALASARRTHKSGMLNWQALALLRNADLSAHRVKAARSRYLREVPGMLSQNPPAVDLSSFNVAIDLALVLQLAGEAERAAQLLDRSEALIPKMPRMGPWGYGIADAQIHALRGDKAKALAALREAEESGWRGPFWRYYRDFDPNLDAIRNAPEFKAVFADIERDMAAQRAALVQRPTNAPLDFGSMQVR